MTLSERKDPLRLFAAVELTREARLAAVEHAARLRAALESRARVSWERSEKLHLTLKFFGNVESEWTAALSGALSRAAAGGWAFALRLQGAGVFPTPARPRVLWLGLSDESGRLAELWRRVEGECAAVNFPAERRPFRPHLTIARVREATAQTRRLAQHHLELGFEPVVFEVSEIVLVNSRLGPGGSVHTPLSKHALGVGSKQFTEAGLTQRG